MGAPRPSCRLLSRALAFCLVPLASAGPLPDTCKPPAQLVKALHDGPSAKMYDAAGAWFAERGDMKCALLAFEEAVRLEPGSAEAHFDLGVAHLRLNQLPAAVGEFRLALKANPGMVLAHSSLGSALSDMGKTAEAEAELREALRIDPKSVPALDHLAQFLASQRRYDAAIRYWNEALALQPGTPDLLLSLGVTTYEGAAAKEAAGVNGARNTGTKEAIRILTELTRQHPDMKAAHFTLGNIFANETRFREAADEYAQVTRVDPSDTVALLANVKALATVSAFQEALAPAQSYVRLKPADAEGHLLLGAVYRGLGEYDKAEAELTRAVAGNPNEFQAQYQLGFVLARNQKTKQALEHLEKAVALKPLDSTAQFQLAAVLRTLGETERAREAAAKFNQSKSEEFKVNQLSAKGLQANEFLQANQPGRAAEAYRQMLEIEPRNARTVYNLALALAAAHDVKGERETLEKALEIDPKMAVAHAELGVLDLSAGNLAAARKHLEEALAIDPQLTSAQGNLGLVLALSGDLAQAEIVFRQALEDDPNYTQGYLNLGLVLAQQQKFVEAEAPLDQALKLAPEDPSVLSAAGKVKARLGESEAGLALLRKVVALSPGSAVGHLDLAIALAGSYDLPGALVETAEAVRLAPQSAVAHFNHGRVLFDLGRGAEARPDFELASRIAPQMAEPQYLLAVLDKQAGNYKNAIALLRNVVQLQPRNPTAWNMLGQCLDHDAQPQEAIAAWKQAIAISPDFTQALWSLSRALRGVDAAEADRLMKRFVAVQKDRRIVDRAETLANDAVASTQAQDWPEATRQLKEAITACGECSIRAELHKKLGLIHCHAGDLDAGEKELRLAQAGLPGDAEVARALALIARARKQAAESRTTSRAR
jgi:tetratricopeptide (TPR) repeat protein